ncbi:hypothetical protein KIPB_008284, partial [Kipferlia bialata]
APKDCPSLSDLDSLTSCGYPSEDRTLKYLDLIQPIPSTTREVGSVGLTEAYTNVQEIIGHLQAELSARDVDAVIETEILDGQYVIGNQPGLIDSSITVLDLSAAPTTVVTLRKASGSAGVASAVSAHLDSHWSGPGICDDLLMVSSMLGTLDALVGAPSNTLNHILSDHDVIMVILGEEENSISGSLAVLLNSQTLTSAQVMLNLEAQGNRTPMFLSQVMSPTLTHDMYSGSKALGGTSLAHDVMRLGIVPSSTDLAAYHNAGLGGLELIGLLNTNVYHTLRDDRSGIMRGQAQQ